jgi:hypothetical protein
MDPDDWRAFCLDVRDQMAHYVYPYTTPISRSEDRQHGWAWGTGNYVAVDDRIFLVTNEHVAVDAGKDHLAHLVRGDEYVRIADEFDVRPWPLDIAATQLAALNAPPKDQCIVPEQFDRLYAPVEHELLFWIGYPGTTAKRNEPVTPLNVRYSWFGSLEIPAVPVLSQEAPHWPEGLPSSIIEGAHIVIHYPELAVRSADERESHVPNPKGMSGSFLWDTKRVACLRDGRDWTVELSRVCGILWAAIPDPAIVAVTPVQHVRELLRL